MAATPERMVLWNGLILERPVTTASLSTKYRHSGQQFGTLQAVRARAAFAARNARASTLSRLPPHEYRATWTCKRPVLLVRVCPGPRANSVYRRQSHLHRRRLSYRLLRRHGPRQVAQAITNKAALRGCFLVVLYWWRFCLRQHRFYVLSVHRPAHLFGRFCVY